MKAIIRSTRSHYGSSFPGEAVKYPQQVEVPDEVSKFLKELSDKHKGEHSSVPLIIDFYPEAKGEEVIMQIEVYNDYRE